MWKELIQRMHRDCEFSPGAASQMIDEAEAKLAIQLPAELRELLLEANGISNWGGGLIWSVDRIAKRNLEFRAFADFRTLYMPFDHLLFFGDNGGGDQFAFRILAGKVEPQNVYRWCHENDAREWQAGDLRDYLARALGHESFYGANSPFF